MRQIKTTEAVGHILCHDITQIIKGVTKDVVFKKGHVVTNEDIPVLLSVGKEHLFIWENQEGMLHENEAAEVLYELCANDYMSRSPVKEGKIELYADCDGLLKIDTERLFEVNMIDEIMVATRHNNFPVKKGDKLAGTRVIPLLVEREKLERAGEIVGDTPLLSIKKYHSKKVGIVTTGSEIYNGRIKDAFGPVICEKLNEYHSEILGQRIVDDSLNMIVDAIEYFLGLGADMVVCTGGMSVDPDDLTPSAIKAAGGNIVSYGAPVLPGAMFLLAYTDGGIPIVGLPGCVMYSARTIFDLMLPRLMADDLISKCDLARLGHGGLCLSCDVCTFPNCGFGKA